MFASIRVRVLVIVILAVVPLAAISTLLAWQSYQAATLTGLHRVSDVMRGFQAAREADISEATNAVAQLASMPELARPEVCADRVALALRLGSPKLDGFAVTGADGHTICTAGGRVPGGPLQGGEAVPGQKVQIGPVLGGAGGGRYEVEEVASSGPGANGFTVSATVRIDRARPVRGRRLNVWLVDGQGRTVSLDAGAARAAVLSPDRSVIDRLLGGAAFAIRQAPDGARWIFMQGRLPGGERFVLGDEATQAEARANAVLFGRIVAIALLLVAGVAGVASAAHVTIAEPVRALTRRVMLWRTGGTFDDGRIRFVSSELHALVGAFGEATRNLASREAELGRSIVAQELLIKEIHHRVKNNLQIIASLLNLQGNRIRQPEARAEFQSARDRVKALATLHRHLYGEGGLHTIAMRGFLEELCGQLFQAMGEREGQRIQLTIDAPELQMTSDQAVPLSLIITEAVSNSLKYAFPAGREGHIAVRLVLEAEDRISLWIDDDGVGIPAGRAETETGVRDGLGITLIRGFARQLEAMLEVTEQDGTHYRLAMKLHRERDPALADAA